ncbi:hypothetical protein SVIOM342S_07898 [Streptomyces violaceorubidus]
MGGEPGRQSVRGVQRRGVGDRVDDGDDGVEAGARDVVGVALAGAVGRVVVRGEDQAGAYGVAGVVDGEDGRAGGGGVAHGDVAAEGLLQGVGQTEGGVHEFLEAEDEDPAGAGGQRLGDPFRHGGQGGLQPGPVGGGESVPSAVGDVVGPVQFDALDGSGRRGGRSGAGRLRGRRLVAGDQFLALLQYSRGQVDGAGGGGHQVDAGADLPGEVVQPPGVRG